MFHTDVIGKVIWYQQHAAREASNARNAQTKTSARYFQRQSAYYYKRARVLLGIE